MAKGWLWGLLAIGGLYMLKDKYLNLPRGIRNHNPLNIKHGDDWLGMAKHQLDKVFVRFTKPVYGIRAAAKVLISYKRQGVVTLSAIIQRWAPDTENDTDSYVRSVAQKTGFESDQVINRIDYPRLLAAMIKHENGIQPYSMELIETGVGMA